MFVNQEKNSYYTRRSTAVNETNQFTAEQIRILEYKLALMLTEALNECCYNRKKRRSK